MTKDFAIQGKHFADKNINILNKFCRQCVLVGQVTEIFSTIVANFFNSKIFLLCGGWKEELTNGLNKFVDDMLSFLSIDEVKVEE